MGQDLIIIQEYCEGGDLAHFIYFKKKSGEQISEELVMQWQLSPRGHLGNTDASTASLRLAQLTHALQYCHKKARILHRLSAATEGLSGVLLGTGGQGKS